MLAADIQTHARKLYETFGPKALAQAAQKARTYETEGKRGDADIWRRIEAALRQMQGPHVS